MLPKVIWAFVLAMQISFSVAQDKAHPFDNLERLYDSSDPSLPWPPAGKAFPEDDFAQWPNQGQQFGKLWPREKVEVLKFAPEFEQFDKKYLGPGKPVVINGMLGVMMAQKPSFDMSSKSLVDSARAALSVYKNSYLSKGDSQRLSFREMLLEHKKHQDIYTRDHLHRNFKTQLSFPSCLVCSDIVDSLFDTRHVFFNDTFPMPLRQENNHQMYCQIEGEKEILLINQKEDFKSWESLDLVDDKVYGKLSPFVNVFKMNYKGTPQYKDVQKFHIASLKAGQCLYVPAGWIHQQTIWGLDHSIEIRWGKSALEGRSQCEGRLPVFLTLGDVAWPGEKVPQPKEKTTDMVRIAIDYMSDLAQEYFLGEDLSLGSFLEKVKKDKSVIADIYDWTRECELVAVDLFSNLDRNKDNTLSWKDLKNVQSADVDHWAGQVYDRFNDFREIGFDQKVKKYGRPGKRTDERPIEYIIAEEQDLELERLSGKTTTKAKKPKTEENSKKPSKDEL